MTGPALADIAGTNLAAEEDSEEEHRADVAVAPVTNEAH